MRIYLNKTLTTKVLPNLYIILYKKKVRVLLIEKEYDSIHICIECNEIQII